MADAGKAGITAEGNWRADIAYEGLSFVKDGSKLYLSKKDVPIGTPTTDTEYWMFCGEGDISEIQREITKIIDGTTTVGKAWKDSDGNFINTTYAKSVDLENHEDSLVTDTDGVHGIRYSINSEKLQAYDSENEKWVDIQTGGGGVSSVIHVDTHVEEWFNNKNVTIKVFNSEEEIDGGHFNALGDYFCNVHYIGDYTIVVTDEDGKEYTKHFEDTTLGGVYYVFIEKGRNYLSWLNSIDAPTSNYHSLDDIFADEKMVRELMTRYASADYLVEWFKDGAEIQDTFISNATAMKWIGLRDYVCDKLCELDGVEEKMLSSDNWEYILKDHVPVMTSNTAPYGVASASSEYSTTQFSAWNAFDGTDYEKSSSSRWVSQQNQTTNQYVQYKFTNPICVKRMRYNISNASVPKEVIIKASNDGNNWVDLISFINDIYSGSKYVDLNNNNHYLYYRFHIINIYSGSEIQIGDIQFYGRSLTKGLIPSMTSNTAPYGECSASSTYYSSDATDIYPYNAFGDGHSKRWYPQSGTFSTVGQWVMYTFKEKVNIDNIKFDYSNQATGASPITTVKAQLYDYSSNGWIDVYQTQEKSTNGIFYNEYAKLSKTYNTDKIRFMGVTNSNCSIGNAQVYAPDYSEREFAEGSNIKYVYDHGVELEEMITSGTVTKNTNSLKLESANAQATKTLDTTSYKLLRGQTIDNASGTNALICGSGTSNFTSSTMPNNTALDVSSINGNNAVGVKQTAVGNFDLSELWLEG